MMVRERCRQGHNTLPDDIILEWSATGVGCDAIVRELPQPGWCHHLVLHVLARLALNRRLSPGQVIDTVCFILLLIMALELFV